MFFKELACFILFSYHCSSAVLTCFVRDSFVMLSCAVLFVNNFFYFFQILFSLEFEAEKEGFEPSRRY